MIHLILITYKLNLVSKALCLELMSPRQSFQLIIKSAKMFSQRVEIRARRQSYQSRKVNMVQIQDKF